MANLTSKMAPIDPTNKEQLERLSKPALMIIIRTMAAKLAAFEKEIIQLKEQAAKLSKNSSTSSKPPSSDIVKPPKSNGGNGSGKKSKRGGQTNHPGHTREPFAPEAIDEIRELDLGACPHCNSVLSEKEKNQKMLVRQLAELPEKLLHITEFHRLGYHCSHCDQSSWAPLPEGIAEGELFGPRLQSLTAYLKGALHGSYTSLEEYFQEVFELDVSRSHLCNSIARVSAALAPAYEELKEKLASEPIIHVDETGHRDNGDRYWTWVFCAKLFGFFTVQKSRSSEVLKEVLGQTFKGKLVSDFYCVYRKYATAFQQFCLAHLIRDIKFLTTLPEKANQQFGQSLLRQFKRLFTFWHRRHTMPQEQYQQKMADIQRDLRALVIQKQLPRKAQNIANRLDKYWSSYLRFIKDPELEPTNNIAEQTVRTIVIDRKITQGTRSEMGRKWSERIWTVLATCRKQNRSSWKFIQACILAHRLGAPYPSLLPAAD